MAKIDKKAMYDAIARHTQAHPDGFTTAQRVASIMQTKAEVDAEILLIDEQRAADESAQVVADENDNLIRLLPVWEQELVEELEGHDRLEVIAELQKNIEKAKAV